LTPGGQNLLIKQAIEEFCPRFTPGAHVLYVGDAGRRDPIFEANALEDLGVTLDKHGKLPDLIVYLPDREWLLLIEAAASHGPVDGKRRNELEHLFREASVGLVFVSCFPSREDMRKYLSEMAWETEVWCADNPSHLIHFNGERFLGPHE
jgi:type II restriction enzyme